MQILKSNAQCISFSTLASLNNFLGTHKNEFLISHYNVRSFKANYDEYYHLKQSLVNDIDIQVFTETWSKVDKTLNIPNYLGYHVVRPSPSRVAESQFLLGNVLDLPK